MEFCIKLQVGRDMAFQTSFHFNLECISYNFEKKLESLKGKSIKSLYLVKKHISWTALDWRFLNANTGFKIYDENGGVARIHQLECNLKD